MAVTSPATPLTVTVTERTWRVTIETPFENAPANYSMSIHRELVTQDSNGNKIGSNTILPPIVLMFSVIAADTVTVGNTTMTVAQISAFLEAYFDQKSTAIGSEPPVVSAKAAVSPTINPSSTSPPVAGA
jgi:hypothetical protein